MSEKIAVSPMWYTVLPSPAAGIARIDLLDTPARQIGGKLMHGEKLGVGLLADAHRVAGMILVPVSKRHVRHSLGDVVQGYLGVLESGVAGEERIDQDVRSARLNAKAGMAEPRDLH